MSTDQLYTVVITISRPTSWQTSSEVAYGPMTEGQVDEFVGEIARVVEAGAREYTTKMEGRELHLLDMGNPIQRVVVYQLQGRDGI
jgi:hypothetical protein